MGERRRIDSERTQTASDSPRTSRSDAGEDSLPPESQRLLKRAVGGLNEFRVYFEIEPPVAVRLRSAGAKKERAVNPLT